MNLVVLFACLVGYGQVNYTTYFLKNNPSKNSFNPAMYRTNAFVKHFGFQSSLQMNTNLNYTDLVEKGSGKLADSLVFNIDRFVSNLDKIGFVDSNFDLTFFQVGIDVNSKQIVRRKKPPRYIEFYLKQKNNTSIDFDKNYLLLLTNGNAPFYNQDFSTGHAGINLSSYMELGITYSRPLLENLTAGLRLKALFGHFNFNTKKFAFGLTGQHHDNVLDISADVHLRMSGSIDVTLNPDGFVEGLSYDPMSNLFNIKNPGIAFDLGVVYEFLPSLRFGVSINDVGKIWWTNETKQLAVNTSYQFEPFDFSQLIENENNNSLEMWLNDTIDSLKDSFGLTKTYASYSERLPFSFNTSLQYEMNSFFDLGLLFTHRVAQNFQYSNLILSANLGIYDFFSLSPVLGLQSGGYFIGCSTSFGISSLQFALAINDVQGLVNPAKIKGLGGSFGMSYIFPLKRGK